MRFEKSRIEFVGADALIGPYRTASSPKGFTFWICKSCGRTESSAPTRWKLNNKKLLQGESALDFTFMIGKYDEKRLTPQLAQALAATKAAEAGADPEKRAAGQRRSRVFVSIFMIVLAAVMIYAAATNPAINRVIYLPVAAAAILASIYMILTRREAAWGMEKPSARTLLKSLNAIETSQKAMVRLRDDGVTITAKRGENHVDYDQITAAAQTEDLIVLRQGRSVTVVQMSDLVGKDVSSVTEALQNALNCPLMILK